VTVDYVGQTVPVPWTAWDGIDYKVSDPTNTGTWKHTPPTTVAQRYSYGRTQPYAGDMTQWIKLQNPNPQIPPPKIVQAKNTFFRHNGLETAVRDPKTGQFVPVDANGNQTTFQAMKKESDNGSQTISLPFDWPVHLNRMLISPIEVVHVSAYPPEQFTRQFVLDQQKAPADPFTRGTPQPTSKNTAKYGFAFQHYAPWFWQPKVNQNSRLYRFFEYVKTKELAADSGLNGRLLGRVNVNTIPGTAGNVGEALAATSPAVKDIFDNGQPGFIFNLLSKLITPTGAPGLNDRPCWGQAAGSSPKGDPQYPGVNAVLINDIQPGGTATKGIVTFTVYDPLSFQFILSKGKIKIPTLQGVTSTGYPWLIEPNAMLYIVDASGAGTFEAVMVDSVDTTKNTVTAKVKLPHTKGSQVVSGGLGMDDTIFRSGPGSAWVNSLIPYSIPVTRVPYLSSTQPAPQHPYQQMQMLTKVYNNLTSRSNVFAVWLTVGFFEVVDDTTRPVKLGAEIGRAENRHIRHRMFAIVDRSWLTSHPGPQTTFDPRNPVVGGVSLPGLIPHLSIID
jgi:hypothetical protein